MLPTYEFMQKYFESDSKGNLYAKVQNSCYLNRWQLFLVMQHKKVYRR